VDGVPRRHRRDILKAARALGMPMIKVDDPDRALRKLGALVGWEP
jgi:hypothetical protein